MVPSTRSSAYGYKAEAVKLYRESNQTIAETARNLGLKESGPGGEPGQRRQG